MATPREILGKAVTQSQVDSFFRDFMGIYNVKAYGCVGDSLTDDTSNLNACMADATTHSAGSIYYPAGTYVVVSSNLSTNFDGLYHWGDGASFSGSTTIIVQTGNWTNNTTVITSQDIDIQMIYGVPWGVD